MKYHNYKILLFQFIKFILYNNLKKLYLIYKKNLMKRSSIHHLSSTENISITNEEKVEILNKKLKYVISSSRYLIQDADIDDYYLLSNLEEIKMNRTQLLEIVLWCLVKPQKNPIDYELIYDYLFFMREFTSLLKKQAQTNIKELINMVASYLEYQNFPEKKIICRFGDKGNKAFIILNGKVDILIKQKKNVNLEVENFLLYLATLLKYKEYALLSLVIKENYDSFPLEIIDDDEELSRSVSIVNSFVKIDEKKKKEFKNFLNTLEINNKENITQIKTSYLSKLFSYNIKDYSEILINYTSTEQYIKRIKVYNNIENINEVLLKYPNIKILNFIVYDYVKIITKETGSLIGEMALNDSSSLRTATMISCSDCEFGVLKKKGYDLSIKICTEKQKRQNINFLLGTALFKNFNYYLLFSKYYNNFISCSFDKGNKICEMNKEINNILFIKEGDFDIFFKISFNEIISLIRYYLKKIFILPDEVNKIRNYLNFEHYQTLNQLNAFFGEERNKIFLNEKRLIKLFSVSKQEIIGVDYFMNIKNKKSFYEVECSSIKGEGLIISYDFYNSMKNSNKIIKKNEYSFIQDKYFKFVERLLTIRQTLINNFYAHESKEKGSTIEDEISLEIEKDKNYNNLFNGKRNLMFYNTNYNFQNNKFPFKFLKKKDKKYSQLNFITVDNKSFDNDKFLMKNTIYKKSKNEKNKFPFLRKNNINYLNSNSNDKLENQLSKVQQTLYQTFSESKQYYDENKNKENNKIFIKPYKFMLNDMIMENINYKKNRSLNNSQRCNNKLKNLQSSFNINTIESNNSDENLKNNFKKKNKKFNNIMISYNPIRSRNYYKFNKPMIVKGRNYYDEIRRLQIKILKK